MDPQTTKPDQTEQSAVEPEQVQNTNLPAEQAGRKKTNYILITVAVVLLLILFGLGGYIIFFSNKPAQEKKSADTTTSATTDITTADPYEGWKTYENEEYYFSFRYPETWQLSEQEFEPLPDLPKMTVDVKDENVGLSIDVDPSYGVTAIVVGANLYDENFKINQYNFYKRYSLNPTDLATSSISAAIVETDSRDDAMLSDISIGCEVNFGIEYSWTPDEKITQSEFKTQTETADLIVKSLACIDPYEGWKTYLNNEHKFSFKYPVDWNTPSTADISGPSTIIFTEKENQFRLEITIDPTDQPGLYDEEYLLSEKINFAENEIPVYLGEKGYTAYVSLNNLDLGMTTYNFNIKEGQYYWDNAGKMYGAKLLCNDKNLFDMYKLILGSFQFDL